MIKFCPDCGTALELKEFEQKRQHFCPYCKHIYYPQLKVAAGGFIEQDGKLLLLQRTGAPFQHCWNIPAGYAEVDESPFQAAVREVYEETGLRVEVYNLIDVYFFSDDPRGNGILIVFKCKLIGGELHQTLEGANPTFFAACDIPKNLAGGGHDQAIRAWVKCQRT
ncbi:MAG: NUDIX domain-containing protein [Candidatus Aureabacteria bacterium]|nr:NUDIX domain-containing protein [Candidatus Auribacterota bacterium]